jgi:AcrR family transcriptional regulator
MAATAAAVGERGLEVTVNEIADLADVSRMTIYRHFTTREELLTRFLLHESQRLADELTTVLDDSTVAFQTRLREAVVFVVRSVRQTPHLHRLVTEGNLAADWPGIDQTNQFVDVTTAFFEPYLVAAKADGVEFRAPIDETLDWLLRLALMLMTVDGGHGLGEDRLRTEVDTFVLPSIIT